MGHILYAPTLQVSAFEVHPISFFFCKLYFAMLLRDRSLDVVMSGQLQFLPRFPFPRWRKSVLPPVLLLSLLPCLFVFSGLEMKLCFSFPPHSLPSPASSSPSYFSSRFFYLCPLSLKTQSRRDLSPSPLLSKLKEFSLFPEIFLPLDTLFGFLPRQYYTSDYR